MATPKLDSIKDKSVQDKIRTAGGTYYADALVKAQTAKNAAALDAVIKAGVDSYIEQIANEYLENEDTEQATQQLQQTQQNAVSALAETTTQAEAADKALKDKAAKDKAAADKAKADAAANASPPTEQQIAADERLTAQCILIDLIPELAQFNSSHRTDLSNQNEKTNYTVCMTGDTNYFSSYVNGNNKKSKFLDFTNAQLSSLTPVLKIYKVIQDGDGSTKDYLIPFSTHTAWRSGLTTYGSVEDLFNEGRERPMDVGIKSFSWTQEGTNPVSSRRDISAKLVLFSNNLDNLVETFNIYANDGAKNCFKYADLILRSGKKFNEAKQYNAQYYTIKIQIGWKTENESLFPNKEQRESLEKNITTMMLTLIDHQFDFKQDGTLTLTMDYRAYFEGLLFSDSADVIKSSEDEATIEEKKVVLRTLQKQVEDEKDPDDPDTKTDLEKKYDDALKEFSEFKVELNKNSFRNIVDSLTAKGQIYTIAIDVAQYNVFKTQLKSSDSITNVGVESFFFPKQGATTGNATTAISAVSLEGDNPDLTTLVPEEVNGYKYISFFYLGDLLNHVINKTYDKLKTEPNKPNFLFGSALYRSRSNNTRIARVNIMDIPISLDWYTEWFSNTIISQRKESYQLLYFLRDLCSKLINNIMSSKCDKSGVLKLLNKFNTVDLLIKKDGEKDFIFNEKLKLGELSVEKIQEIISKYSPDKDTDFSSCQSYIAFYCYDASSPTSVDCVADHEKGIYHFYFGRDRGLIKNINFTRAQTTGLRELNYVRESSGYGLEQLMTPYDVEMKMVGNNLFINGMMIYINPSGFGRAIGEPYDVNSVSYKLKLGGYHTIYRIESTISTSGFDTTVKARWTGSGTKKQSPVIAPTNEPIQGSTASGASATQTNPQSECTTEYDSGFSYPFSIGSAPADLGTRQKPTPA